MAFLGSRGGSRGRGPSSGGFRGRGGNRGGGRGGGRGGAPSRGRGEFRGRGRGKGRGKPIFDSARVADQEADEEEGSKSHYESPSDQEDVDEEDSSGEDDEPIQSVSAYEALMQSFASEAPREAKRRKIEHVQEPEVASSKDDESQDGSVDEVEEAEEGPETATEGLLDDDDDLEDPSDSFDTHFANPDDNLLLKRLKAIQHNEWTFQRVVVPKIGTTIVAIPESGGDKITTLPMVSGPADLKLKQKLANVAWKVRPTFNDLEKTIAPVIFNYQDMLFCDRNMSNQEDLRRLTCLHAINHVFKTRDRVIKDNARLAKDESGELEFKDQGFTRPKVLMILPTRESCVRVVNMITTLCEPEQQENRKRFDDSYVEKDTKFSAEKPADFQDLFEGNDDDLFRLGLKFTRRTIKYFSQFYNSDIIFASPLGLRFAIEGKDDKKGDYDFLSSIEMVIVNQADALLMQNWEHVEYIFEHLNLRPTDSHGCDYSRVRNWYLEDQQKNFRQIIALSAFNTPEINSMFFNQSKNWAGKVKISPTYPGVIHQHVLGVRAKQTFSRFGSPTIKISEDPDARFEYFTKAIVPGLSRRAKDTAGTLIFIPSYFDFVRVRKYFVDDSTLSFGSISEHTEVSDVSRARSHFLNERHSVLLYSERAHHFRRYQLRGVKKVIMYGLPDNPLFYKEIVGGSLSRSVQEGKLGREEGSVRVLFSKWDRFKLERIAGTERVGKMITEKGDTFDFV